MVSSSSIFFFKLIMTSCWCFSCSVTVRAPVLFIAATSQLSARILDVNATICCVKNWCCASPLNSDAWMVATSPSSSSSLLQSRDSVRARFGAGAGELARAL